MILQGTGNDLRGRRGCTVGQHHEWHCFQNVRRIGQRIPATARVVFFARHVARLAAFHAPFGVDDECIFRQEHCGQADRGVEQSAGVVTQVKHHAFKRCLRVLLGQRLRHVGDRGFVKRADTNERHARLNHLGFYALNLDLLAHQRERLRAAVFLAEHFQTNLGARIAAHHVDRFSRGQAARGFAVNLGDQVARTNARFSCGCFVNRRDYFDKAVLSADLDTNAAEFTGGRGA